MQKKKLLQKNHLRIKIDMSINELLIKKFFNKKRDFLSVLNTKLQISCNLFVNNIFFFIYRKQIFFLKNQFFCL